ncbi:MAG TPA: sigma 54-interacting transcriptional regulator [Planctomycetota bacterium]
MQLLLDVWREACRHIEIGEFVARIGPRLKERIPFRLLFVRRVELDRGRIETVASTADARGSQPQARTECSPQELDEVLRWCKTGVPLAGGPGPRPALLRLLAPPDLDGPVLAGPLASGDELGILLFAGERGAAFAPASLGEARELLEPFAVALENDHRFHELARLREAALADNEALLSRLGRQDISESIVGAESGLKSVLERVDKVAATDAPVLILGETGSGKEVIARALHTRSPRRTGPIVRVNCGAIPSELVDSELFGHEKGSFTGAIATHRGWFERADGGTLFLDEIGELPPAAQVRLLRILQDGTFERVGGGQTRTVDVRLVAATHRDLEDMVAEGTFRQDLWYRISVFPIHLPPLRERPGDIPHLAAHFAASAGKRLGGAPLAVAPPDLSLLLAYPWPGNVRELAAVIERAAILGDGKRLEVAAALGRPLAATPRSTPAALLAEPAPAPTSLESAMRRHIEEALTSTRGQIEGDQGAARLLGINPHTLRARMRKLGIDWQRYRANA